MDVDDILTSSIEAKLCPEPPLSSRACIFRVPHVLSRQSEGAFAPNIVSIGPFHHGHENLKRMEEFKLWYLHGLLSRAPTSQTSLKIFTKAIRQLEERARECYAEHLMEFDTDEFVEMMLVDGCFILELFRKKVNGIERQRDDPISNTPWMDSYLRVDLMLLENQIPWFVLECLFNLTVPSGEMNPSFAELALGFFDTMMPMTVPAKSSSRFETKHLLDLLWNSIISASADVELTLENEYWEVIPKVKNLVEAGVKFRKGSPEEILNIRFEDGVMEIPPLLIQGSTELLFRNLMAYEQCCFFLPNRITSYVVFLDSLINSSKDVHLLGDQGILENWLSTEEDASLFFSRVWKGGTLHKFYYVGICQKVNAYYGTSWHKWRATLKRDYFNNPWTIISFIGAIVMLVLTLLQALFSILSFY
ncbi:UPF0481 protein At3g47200-like [Macadamia integrifolia]|uniref:UPF0481 protein At3g47200-like n=1 Tax=Macadamia integrifolia TaxID=60698 RepID=UPI001C53207C|nr:UPF0481 protein At3g47200-like [Macadamia integrifolia]XP_042519311.1 UPF0481 protein At3g47200-like [Macadamia integrifolia]XP_042519312.1 UPF0481 protein At3g47200-like [Macadamia integrifolia]XP_042519313.1 UPF0481 protein At3g47200-like [Macadamia integrifolia]XP_042519314.1 UPF0481 protein At3g47200-like [Macadamia integrifolia]XP_042519315.1 UPF0481 protein At3g47200-like [Macadamia integrifolia]XP_042519316.1 UPF0481 protein At3g47200-like [Macadamia integrifolia]XP_042519317.1 UPF